MIVFKTIFLCLLVLFWIFLLVKEGISQKYGKENWQKNLTCKLGLHKFKTTRFSIFTYKKCEYCDKYKAT